MPDSLVKEVKSEVDIFFPEHGSDLVTDANIIPTIVIDWPFLDEGCPPT